LSNLIARNELDINYSIEIRADVINKLPKNTIVKLIESGCAQFNLGLEKGSDKALQRFQKSMTIEEHEKAIRKIRSASYRAYNYKEDNYSIDILINGTFILGGPGETKEDIKDTLSHGFKLDLDGLRFFPLEIHLGTEIYRQAVDDQIIQTGIIPYLDPNNYPIYETSILTKEYLFQVQEMAEKVSEDKNQIRQEFYDLKKNLRHMDDEYNKVEEYIKKINSQFKRFINSVLELIRKI
jgi:radical SAM superfamily enzyme YgiQ (UPF0313 family)